MRWTPRGRSANLDDLRGQGRGMGMGGALPKMGIGGFLVLLLLSFIFGKDFFSLAGGGGQPATSTATQGEAVPTTPEEEKQIEFVSFVLDDAQSTWSQIFQKSGQTYQPARLGIFTNAVETACGVGQSGMGPFYCPADERVYIDLTFYNELQSRFQAAGDFAQAYVIAHEIGHHVQNVLGISSQVREAQQRDPDRANELSVRLEAPGRLPGRRVGALHLAARHPRGGRRRRGPRSRRRRGRRSHPEQVPGRSQSGDLDPRLLRAAHALVPERLPIGGYRTL